MLSALGLLAEAEVPRLEPGRCARARLGSSSCRRCADACPSGAVDASERLPLLDPRSCTGCRLCQGACPTGAIGDGDELERAVRELGERPRPVLGCRSPGTRAHARVGCLGLLDAEALLALASLFPDGIVLNVSGCATCPGGAIVPALRAALDRLAALPGDAAARVKLADSEAALEFTPDALSRRQFLAGFRRRAASAAGAAIERARPAAPGAYGDRTLPAGRRLLLGVLPSAAPALRAAAGTELFPRLAFGPECRRCLGCVGVCPTGALETAPDDPPRPAFERSLCTGCGLCVELCRRKAPALVRGGLAAR